MTMHRDEGAVVERAVPGPALYQRSVVPDAPRAMVGLLHGYADHGARYARVMDAWAERGIGTVALDLRGHGKAAGPRGFCHRFDEYLDDGAELARLVADRGKGQPAFLFGHSFGGLVAVSSILENARSWRGLLLSAPYIGLALAVPRVKVLAGKIASRVVPRMALPSGIKGSDCTHDAVIARAYDTDPLVFKTATARWFTEATAAQERALARASELKTPLYVAFGTTDPVARYASGRALFDRAGSSDKTWRDRVGAYHEILNEPDWLSLANDMGDWILAHA